MSPDSLKPLVEARVLEQLAQLEADQESVLTELYQAFQRSVDRNFAKIESCLAANDCPSAARAAHSLKSTFGNFGAHSTVDNCRSFEEAALENNLTQCKEIYQSMQKCYPKIRQEIESFIAELD